MAVTLASTVTGTNFSGSGVTVTAANVVVSAGDIIVVEFGWRRNAAQTLSSVTFNASATGLSAITGASVQNPDASAEQNAYVGVGLSGTHDVVVTLSANSPVMMVIVRVLSGADTGSPYGTVVNSNGNDNPSDTVSSAVGGLCLDAFILRNDDTMTADSGQTNTSSLGVGQGTQMGFSVESGAASVSMGWTGNVGGDGYAYYVIPITALAGGGGTTIAPQLGSVPMTGRALGCGLGIGLPDQP